MARKDKSKSSAKGEPKKKVAAKPKEEKETKKAKRVATKTKEATTAVKPAKRAKAEPAPEAPPAVAVEPVASVAPVPLEAAPAVAKPAPKKKYAGKTIQIRWIRSGIGFSWRQKQIIRGLGFRKLNQVITRPDTPAIRGMVAAIPHLVAIVDASNSK